MTAQMKNRLRIINRHIKKNTPRIRRRLTKLGLKVDEPTLISAISAAKYIDALNKLAKE